MTSPPTPGRRTPSNQTSDAFGAVNSKYQDPKEGSTSLKPQRLSEEISELIEAFEDRSVTLREVIEVLRGRAYILLLILLALPFCTPIPLPGVSTPFGLVIAVIGFRLALRQEPWLPRRLQATKVPARFFRRLLGAARGIIRALEVFLRPRWTYLLDAKLPHHGYGATVCVCGILLLLPLPIPLSNGLPALTVVLIACAILERDGYCLVAGLLTFAVTLCFFGAILWGGAEVAGWLHEHLDTLFGREGDVDL